MLTRTVCWGRLDSLYFPNGTRKRPEPEVSGAAELEAGERLLQLEPRFRPEPRLDEEGESLAQVPARERRLPGGPGSSPGSRRSPPVPSGRRRTGIRRSEPRRRGRRTPGRGARSQRSPFSSDSQRPPGRTRPRGYPPSRRRHPCGTWSAGRYPRPPSSSPSRSRLRGRPSFRTSFL